ncbi:MAG: CRISPR-associated endonuclease Cas1 [Rhodospirillales bacterium]|nr:CRISPR-associated endonuclease Cas1 [Rhodospirillales bacterium]
MATVYIDRKGIDLDHEAGVIVLRLDGVRTGTVPLGPVDRLVIRGARMIAVPLMAELWRRGISLVVLGGRNGGVQTLVQGPVHGDASIRLRQYVLHQRPLERAARARSLVLAKVTAQRRLLREGLQARPDARKPLLDAIVTVEAIRTRLVESSTEQSEVGALTLDQLMGLEGAAAAAHFAGLAALFAPALGFTGRNRRPPRDPVNACLSLGYTLLHAEAVREAHIVGLDPMLGVFHQPLAGRESLASDLVEPLRPRLDRYVWQLFRQEILRPTHFTKNDGACLLGKAGRRSFYEGYERFVPPLRRWLRLACRGFVRDLRAGPSGTQ